MSTFSFWHLHLAVMLRLSLLWSILRIVTLEVIIQKGSWGRKPLSAILCSCFKDPKVGILALLIKTLLQR